MAPTRRRVLSKKDLEENIEEYLNESDFDCDESEDSPFDDLCNTDNVTENDSNEQEHQQNPEQHPHTSSNDSDSFYSVPLSALRTRGRPRTRNSGRCSRRRGRNSRVNPESCQITEWYSGDFNPHIITFIEPAYLPLNSEDFDKIHYFLQYFNENLITLIVDTSNANHEQETGSRLNLSASELYTFMGIVMVMSCIGYPTIRMYWEKKFRVPLIANAMARDRFLFLRNKIKFVIDANVSDADKAADKVWKVRPLINAIQKACMTLPKTQNLCVDEMIMPFTGHCGIKQYCPGKPNPTGLKIFVLADPKGLVLNFDFYQGSTTYPKYDNTNFGLGEKAVLNLTDDIAPGHKLYFDRFFTSSKLINELTNRNLMATGTIQKNRLPAEVKLVLKEKHREMLREGRGACQVLTNSDKKVAITMWLDNKPVILMSNAHAKEPTDICRRWSKNLNSYIYVSRPEVIKAYNSNMGGVNLADRFLSVCPSRYKTRKWTFRVFCHILDLVVCNSWVSYKEDQKARKTPAKDILQLRSYKMAIGQVLLEHYCDTSSNLESEESDDTIRRVKRGRKCVIPTPTAAFRHRNASHMPEFSRQVNRCRICKKKSWMICISCQVHLCIVRERNCFKNFHCS